MRFKKRWLTRAFTRLYSAQRVMRKPLGVSL